MASPDRFTAEYSKRLGTLRGEQLQAALDRFDLGLLVDAAPVTQGLSGQNVFLRTTQGDWVLRGCPHYPWQFDKERFFARLICELTPVPAPWPYLIETSDALFGWRYALMPRLPGSSDLATTPEGRVARARAMGSTLAELHEIHWKHCGEFLPEPGGVVPRDLPWPDCKIRDLYTWLERAREHADATTDADAEWIDEIVYAHSDALEEPFTPTYVHHDFREANTVAEQDGEGLRVTGVFDLMEGYFGDPEEDLVRSIWEYATNGRVDCSRTYVAAYQARRPLRAGARDRFRVYMLHDCLVLWEYGQRMGTFPPQLCFRDFAEHFVSLEVL
jgi:aminoglycoside phosphotransferase (APT) family kinase protein